MPNLNAVSRFDSPGVSVTTNGAFRINARQINGSLAPSAALHSGNIWVADCWRFVSPATNTEEILGVSAYRTTGGILFRGRCKRVGGTFAIENIDATIPSAAYGRKYPITATVIAQNFGASPMRIVPIPRHSSAYDILYSRECAMGAYDYGQASSIYRSDASTDAEGGVGYDDQYMFPNLATLHFHVLAAGEFAVHVRSFQELIGSFRNPPLVPPHDGEDIVRAARFVQSGYLQNEAVILDLAPDGSGDTNAAEGSVRITFPVAMQTAPTITLTEAALTLHKTSDGATEAAATLAVSADNVSREGFTLHIEATTTTAVASLKAAAKYSCRWLAETP